MSQQGKIGLCPVCRNYFPKNSPEAVSVSANGLRLFFDSFECANVFDKITTNERETKSRHWNAQSRRRGTSGNSNYSI